MNHNICSISLVIFLIGIFSQSLAQKLPFAADITPQLENKLIQAYKAKNSDYQAHTEHFCGTKQPCYDVSTLFRTVF